jgi:hypothetical protein
VVAIAGAGVDEVMTSLTSEFQERLRIHHALDTTHQ